jgi:hypothetical protein
MEMLNIECSSKTNSRAENVLGEIDSYSRRLLATYLLRDISEWIAHSKFLRMT